MKSKKIEEKYTACTACRSSGKLLKFQLPMTEDVSLPVSTEPGREIQIDFSCKLQNKQVTGELYILIGIGRYI